MTDTKILVRDILKANWKYLSTADIQQLLPEKRCRSAVRRALRRLKNDGDALSSTQIGQQHRRDWVFSMHDLRQVDPPKSDPPKPAQPRTPTQTPTKPGASMCNQTATKPSLVAAVEVVVNEFVAATKQFSAHDVTNEVRNRVNVGTLTVDKAEVGVVHIAAKDANGAVIGGQEMPRIDHDSIKDAVTEMFHNDKMTGYDRVFTGVFFNYGPAAAAPAPVDPATPTPAADGSSYSGDPTL